MNFLIIKNPSHPSLIKIKTLYEQAFPQKERREFAELVRLIQLENMELMAIENSSILLGFLILWTFKSFRYLEHFVIDPSQRSKSYGSAVMKKIITNSNNTLLLEVEPPHNDISKKRIIFYERLGMKICPYYYEQPPYRINENSFPMLIMSFPHELSKPYFEEFTSIIKTEVYERYR
jgi:ribosomal protein S18 acetylase RimI-like enzyme